LTEAAIDTLGHVDIIPCCSTATIFPLFSLDRNSLGRANLNGVLEVFEKGADRVHSFAELAGNTTLFT
jgi:hypothetical protein